MKIRNILENIDAMVNGPSDAEPIAYQKKTFDVTMADLNTLQLRTLERIANGLVTVDTASDREFEVMEDLHALGVLNDEYELSDIGRNLLNSDQNSDDLSSAMADVDIEADSGVDDLDSIPDDEFEELEDFSSEYNMK